MKAAILLLMIHVGNLRKNDKSHSSGYTGIIDKRDFYLIIGVLNFGQSWGSQS